MSCVSASLPVVRFYFMGPRALEKRCCCWLPIRSSLMFCIFRRILLRQGQFSHLPGSLDAEQAFRVRSLFCFHDTISVAQPASPLLYLWDVCLGAIHFDQPFLKSAESFLEQLLHTNA